MNIKPKPEKYRKLEPPPGPVHALGNPDITPENYKPLKKEKKKKKKQQSEVTKQYLYTKEALRKDKEEQEKIVRGKIAYQVKKYNELMDSAKHFEKLREQKLEDAIEAGYGLMRLDRHRFQNFGGEGPGNYDSYPVRAEQILKPSPQPSECCSCCSCSCCTYHEDE